MPSPHVLVYDGSCGLCQRSVRLIQWLKPTAPFRYIDYHDAPALAEYPTISRAQAEQSVILRTPDGQQYHGYDAICQIIRLLPRLSWLYPLLRLRPIRAIGTRLYAWVTRHRHRISHYLFPAHKEAQGRASLGFS